MYDDPYGIKDLGGESKEWASMSGGSEPSQPPQPTAAAMLI
jgi:hypothetical protein